MSKKTITENKTFKEKILEELKNKSSVEINDLRKSLDKLFIEASLEVEFDSHIGYEKHDKNSREYSNNYRKGKTNKKVKTTNGVLDIEIPRDKNATFEPILISKHQRNLTYIEELFLDFMLKD